MKLGKYLFVFFLLVQNGYSQTNAKKEIFNKDFKCSITVPENFETLSP